MSDLHLDLVVIVTQAVCSELRYFKSSEMKVVIFTRRNVVTPVAENSLPLCSDLHYSFFTVYIKNDGSIGIRRRTGIE